MEYCSYIDPRAKAIGAVNTVVNKTACSTAITPIIWALPTCATPTA